MQAGDAPSPQSREALEQLCRTYWYPLYVFVRRQGLPPSDAEDITQGFFGQLLEKSYLKDVNRERGRFRSFLLASIKHFLLNELKHAKRLKRGGGKTIVAIDGLAAESSYHSELCEDESPEQSLDRCWATTVMEAAMDCLQREYVASGKADLHEALSQFLATEPEAGEYDSLAPKLGMNKNALGVAVHRLRRRYGELIRLEVANTVADPLEVEEEMRYLHRVLTGD